MKKTGILNHHLADVVARIGHTQRLIVCDAGMPIPPHVERIDLAITPGLPTVSQVLHALVSELQVEAIVLADELLAWDKSLAAELSDLFPGAPISSVPHDEFKKMSESSIAIVRSGECTPYYNVMLISGVTY